MTAWRACSAPLAARACNTASSELISPALSDSAPTLTSPFFHGPRTPTLASLPPGWKLLSLLSTPPSSGRPDPGLRPSHPSAGPSLPWGPLPTEPSAPAIEGTLSTDESRLNAGVAPSALGPPSLLSRRLLRLNSSAATLSERFRRSLCSRSCSRASAPSPRRPGAGPIISPRRCSSTNGGPSRRSRGSRLCRPSLPSRRGRSRLPSSPLRRRSQSRGSQP